MSPHPIIERSRAILGVICLATSLLLLGPGIAAVRADEHRADESPVEAVPAESDGEIESAPRSAHSPVESAPGIVVLNTRGYNYGPDRPTALPVLPATPRPIPSEPSDAPE